MQDLNEFQEDVRLKIQEWLEGPYDSRTKEAIANLLKDDPKQLHESFHSRLKFGTAGIRAIMGVGCNRLNQYTIRFATQGFANHLLKINPKAKVVIGYDTRINSHFFAEVTARVFAGNNIQTYLFLTVCPTPLLSYACRELGCDGAVMITASHNPPEYNGFKVYGKNGGQIASPEDQEIISEVDQIESLKQVKYAPKDSKYLHHLDRTPFRSFIGKIQTLQKFEELDQTHGRDLHIIYSNLHGTGVTVIPEALANWGFTHMDLVDKQLSLDGFFPNACPPNPEEKKALSFGVKQMMDEKADLFIATDPDADRLGCVIRHKKTPFYLNGNQIACLCLHHLLTSSKVKNPFTVKSIVTTELFRNISEHFNATCYDVLTGFKYIAEKMDQLEGKENFVLGAEESYGYLPHLFCRDKDAISIACILAEIALIAKQKKKTLKDLLFKIFEKYGVYFESIKAISLPDTEKSMIQINHWMKNLRSNSLDSIDGVSLIRFDNYLTKKILRKGEKPQISPLPKSNVLGFWFEDGTKVMVRPSGTEPKIKIYIGLVSHKKMPVEKQYRELEKKAKDWLKKIEQTIYS